MQEFAHDDPGHCFAIEAGPGDVVIVPPGWAHATISADLHQPLTFGAWCDREYGYLYDELRARGGLAWHPILTDESRIEWRANPRYQTRQIEVRPPRCYTELGLEIYPPIYSLIEREPDSIQWASKPGLVAEAWRDFTP
jgi:glucose-6-phosphate isomerase